jgi:hypothetical protein
MAEEKSKFTQALESSRRWIKLRWKIIVSLILWVGSVLTVSIAGTIHLSDRIQAASMITLVFITWFYAVQTQALVKEQRRSLEEEKKKRVADFGEKRISELLVPLNVQLGAFQYRTLQYFEEMDNRSFDEYVSDANKHLGLIARIFHDKTHLANNELIFRMKGLLLDSQMELWGASKWTEDEKKKYRTWIGNEITFLIHRIEEEIEQVSKHIQDTYSGFTHISYF